MRRQLLLLRRERVGERERGERMGRWRRMLAPLANGPAPDNRYGRTKMGFSFTRGRQEGRQAETSTGVS